MAKCRECDGEGTVKTVASEKCIIRHTCQSCGGSGEVSQSPEHMTSKPNLHPMVHSDTISLLRACRDLLEMVEEESCDDLAKEVTDHLKALGVE